MDFRLWAMDLGYLYKWKIKNYDGYVTFCKKKKMKTMHVMSRKTKLDLGY